MMSYGMIQAYLNLKLKKLYSLVYFVFIGACGLLILFAFYKIAPLPEEWAKLSPFGWSFLEQF